MIRRFLLLTLLGVVLAACSSAADTPSSTTKVVASPPTPAGSPQVATPTAMLAVPVPTASPVPVAEASPSPVAVGSPAASPGASPVAVGASPVAVASPAAGASPVAAGSPAPSTVPLGGPRFRIVSEQSEAFYRATETFANQPGPVTAVGRTNDVEGEIQLEQDGILRGRVLLVRIDLRTLTSDQSRRDSYIRQNTLQTDLYPYAEFHSTELAGPSGYREGEEVTFQIPGLMTIKGQERPIVWEARAKLQNDTLTATATARVKLTDFGLQPPRLAILSVEDEMTWQIDLVAERVQ